MSVAAVILAAGESRRMGSPKALLPFRGGTFASALAELLGEFCVPVIAVIGFDAARVSAELPASVVAVVNPDYQAGMLTSLQTGLRALGDSVDRVVFTLVDHPAVRRETIASLRAEQAPIVIPRIGSERGHPVVIDRSIVHEFLREPASSKVRDVIDRHASEIRYVDVLDLGITDDVDDPARYDALLAREAGPR